MKVEVRFADSSQTFTPQFGEVHEVSDGGFDRGYAQGYGEGETEGYTKGHAEGVEQGYAEGHVDGYNSGYGEGKSDGIEKGYSDGYKVGNEDGLETGYKDGYDTGYAEGVEAGSSDGGWVIGDGNTRLHVSFKSETRLTLPLCFQQSVSNGVLVDWGDGSEPETFDGSSSTKIRPTHTYSSVGDYVVTLSPSENCAITLGGSSSGGVIPNDVIGGYQNILQKVEIGKGTNNIGSYAFERCSNLTDVYVPDNITIINSRAFRYCYSLKNVRLPDTVVSLRGYAFESCSSLKNAHLSDNINMLEGSVFSKCSSLTNVNIPSKVTRLQSNTFDSCISLIELYIPNSVTHIDAFVFQKCTSMGLYDFSDHTSVPSLSATNAFTNIPSDCEIHVPLALVDEWKAATNWSTYADHIVGV